MPQPLEPKIAMKRLLNDEISLWKWFSDDSIKLPNSLYTMRDGCSLWNQFFATSISGSYRSLILHCFNFSSILENKNFNFFRCFIFSSNCEEMPGKKTEEKFWIVILHLSPNFDSTLKTTQSYIESYKGYQFTKSHRLSWCDVNSAFRELY